MIVRRLLLCACLCSVTAAQVRANLVPNPEFRLNASGKPVSWQFWSPRPDLQPRADVWKDADAGALRLTSIDFGSFGKWLAKDIPVSAGRFYRFEVLYEPKGIVNERGSVGVMLSWDARDGQPVQRDYVDQISAAEKGWSSGCAGQNPVRSASRTRLWWNRLNRPLAR